MSRKLAHEMGFSDTRPGAHELTSCCPESGQERMASNDEFSDYVVEQSGLGDLLTFRKMFGGCTFYLDGKVIALACDNSLFLKPTDASRTLAPGLPERPPYPGAKDFPVADELLDDTDLLRELLLATSAALPMPKPKRPRRTRAE
jgi:TfoX/Sxy family transcriptional regulator of competence genes